VETSPRSSSSRLSAMIFNTREAGGCLCHPKSRNFSLLLETLPATTHAAPVVLATGLRVRHDQALRFGPGLRFRPALRQNGRQRISPSMTEGDVGERLAVPSIAAPKVNEGRANPTPTLFTSRVRYRRVIRPHGWWALPYSAALSTD
jgi:hypothetical protein